VVWGCEGKGQAAADQFFEELDPPADPPGPERVHRPRRAPAAPAIMVPFGPCPTVSAGHGIHGAWLPAGDEIEPAIFARASRLTAVSMDMGEGYAKSVREHAPQAQPQCVGTGVARLHVPQPFRNASDSPPPWTGRHNQRPAGVRHSGGPGPSRGTPPAKGSTRTDDAPPISSATPFEPPPHGRHARRVSGCAVGADASIRT
jgi:hypothetical protein